MLLVTAEKAITPLAAIVGCTSRPVPAVTRSGGETARPFGGIEMRQMFVLSPRLPENSTSPLALQTPGMKKFSNDGSRPASRIAVRAPVCTSDPPFASATHQSGALSESRFPRNSSRLPSADQSGEKATAKSANSRRGSPPTAGITYTRVASALVIRNAVLRPVQQTIDAFFGRESADGDRVSTVSRLSGLKDRKVNARIDHGICLAPVQLAQACGGVAAVGYQQRGAPHGQPVDSAS